LKRNHAAFLMALALAIFGYGAYPIPAQASAVQSGIGSMLEKIPLSAFKDGWLSYADVSVLIANTPGALEPGSAEAFERLKDTPWGSATLRAYTGLSSGPGDFYTHVTRSREMLLSSGLDFFQVRRLIEAGVMPNRQIWLSGAFDKEGIGSILRGKGYLQVWDTTSEFEIWCKGGDITSGLKTDLLHRDPNFPFGGNLGRSWPVMLSDTLIGSTPDAQSVQAAADAVEPSLMSLGALSDLIGAVTAGDAQDTNSLAQLYLLTPSAAGLDLPGLPEGLGQTGPAQADASSAYADQQPLPAYAVLALAHLYSHGTQRVVAALSFPDGESAAAAERVIDSRLQKAVSLRTGDLMTDSVQAMGGRMEPLHTTAGQSGSHILVIPFNFPAQTAAEGSGGPASIPGEPFHFFTGLLMSRDLGWLTIGLPQ